MDILNATRPAARVVRLQSHLEQLLRITAASWGLAAPPAAALLPRAQPGPAHAVAPARHAPPGLRA
jgi:hypothetical protein